MKNRDYLMGISTCYGCSLIQKSHNFLCSILPHVKKVTKITKQIAGHAIINTSGKEKSLMLVHTELVLITPFMSTMR